MERPESSQLEFEQVDGSGSHARKAEALASLHLISQTITSTRAEVEMSSSAAGYIVVGCAMLLGLLGTALVKGWGQALVWLVVTVSSVAAAILLRRQHVATISRSAQWLLGRQAWVASAILVQTWAVVMLGVLYHAYPLDYTLVVVGLSVGFGIAAESVFIQPRRALVGLAYIVGSLLTAIWAMDYQLYTLALTFGLPMILFGLYLRRRG